jgi:hypothetical protein
MSLRPAVAAVLHSTLNIQHSKFRCSEPNARVLPFARPPDRRHPTCVCDSASTIAMKVSSSLLVCFFAVSLYAAPMVRVLRVAGPNTIVVEQNGVPGEVRLTGIEITDPQSAVAYLSWTLQSSWVLVEDGRVYRSPDGLLVNDDLVRKGFARSTTAVILPRTAATYLGELNPEPVKASARQPARPAKAVTPSRVRPPTQRVQRARARRRP